MKNYLSSSKALWLLTLGMTFQITSMAQKATAPKQDEILAKQAEAIERLEEIVSNQEALLKMYGSQINLEDDIDKMSYAYGISFGESFKAQGISEMNYMALTRGIEDVLEGKETLMTNPQAQQFLNDYVMGLMQAKAEETKRKCSTFLAENAKRPEVKTTDSGLQYEVLKEGEGTSPTATSKVTVHYEGKLIDGAVFDSSIKRGKPATFGLNQVIKGWTEGLQLMKPGAKYRFYIPSDLAYGDQGAGQTIGPGEALIFDVELISVE